MNSWVFCCIVFVASARSSYGVCQFPPDLWCSTPEIAATCNVSTQCEGWNCLAKRDAKPVDVVIYYESMCSECSNFINNSLVIAHKEVAEIMNLQLVPYGRAETLHTNVGDISGTDLVTLMCQNYQGPFPYGCRTELRTTSQSCRTA